MDVVCHGAFAPFNPLEYSTPWDWHWVFIATFTKKEDGNGTNG